MLVKEVLSEGFENWKDIQTIVRIKSERSTKKTGQKSTKHSYYFNSPPDNAKLPNGSVRGLWRIENNSHWDPDIILGTTGT